ncbi:MAG TPA: FAD-binding protein [Gemmatimonadaceae bacterium]
MTERVPEELHPETEEAIADLVVRAREAGRRVRVRGANHSVPSTIAGPGDIVLVLDRLKQLHYDAASGEVTAGAGIRLGVDPLDPLRGDGTALCPWLHARGRALPNLGGVIHQTVAGFLATGSGGGSARFDCATSVVGLRFVDGTGRVHALRRETDEDCLNAVLVSIGSCGVVTSVTFRTEPAYDVAGSETVLPDCGGPVDLFADGATGLAAFFEKNDYARILWWPQRGVRRIVVWAVQRILADDPAPARGYEPLPTVFGSTQPLQIAGGAALWAIVHWRRIGRLFGPRALRALERLAAPLEGALYRAFVDGDPERSQRFRGAWWEILPQDAKMDERWMPTTFTEIFVPLARAGVAMRSLDRLFASDPSAAGRFAIELYAARASASWLHPAYGHAALRINVFWLMHEPSDPRDEFLPRIWEALAEFHPRLHWAKLFPHEPATMVCGRFPRMDDFLALRERLDPDGVFLTEWLSTALGVSSPRPERPFAPLPRRRTRSLLLSKPMR